VLLSSEREALIAEQQRLCLACAAPVVRDALARVTDQWLAVQPLADAPCYVTFSLAEVGQFEDMHDWHRDIAALLERTAGGCVRCGKAAARFVWLPTEESQSLKELQYDTAWFRDRQAFALCDDCAAAAVLDSFRDRGIKVYELVLPKAGPGVWLPWGY
jgi:hypothetical protein